MMPVRQSPVPPVAMPGLPVGKLGFYAGNFMASADTVKITLTGYGGHGAHPERTVDPIVAGAPFNHQ